VVEAEAPVGVHSLAESSLIFFPTHLVVADDGASSYQVHPVMEATEVV